MNIDRLRAMLGHGVRRIWFASDCKDLEDKVDQRDKAAMKLEAAETKLIRNANAKRLKAEKKGQAGPSEESGEASHWLDPKDRPTHKTKFLIGKKVDSIDWCRNELKTLIPEVDRMQSIEKSGEGKFLNSVFVEFETLSEAQSAYQSLTHHQALHMSPRFTGMTPSDVSKRPRQLTPYCMLITNLSSLRSSGKTSPSLGTLVLFVASRLRRLLSCSLYSGLFPSHSLVQSPTCRIWSA